MEDARPKVILVAEDDADTRLLLQRTLESRGYRVLPAIDGEDALEQAAGTPPDLILLDVNMPRMDGLEACRRLRADARTRHLPVIMVTVRSQPPHVIAGFAAGADDYLTKPFDAGKLLARIEVVLRRAEVSPRGNRPGLETYGGPAT